jgi:hypothetical protein
MCIYDSKFDVIGSRPLLDAEVRSVVSFRDVSRKM